MGIIEKMNTTDGMEVARYSCRAKWLDSITKFQILKIDLGLPDSIRNMRVAVRRVFPAPADT